MQTSQPIKNLNDLEKLKNYYRWDKPNARNSLLIVMGLNTALRISDMLELKWISVYNFQNREYRSHLNITEQKTGKITQIYLNKSIKIALGYYRWCLREQGKMVRPGDFLFSHTNKNVPITRVQAFRIVKNASAACELPGIISCHSLRKTFGYHAWKQGVPPALLVNIYNHSSYEVTKRYLGIEQDDRDQIFRDIRL